MPLERLQNSARSNVTTYLLVFPATRFISRDISKTPERRKAVKLTTLKTSLRLGETPNTWRYEWRNHTPPRTLVQTLAS